MASGSTDTADSGVAEHRRPGRPRDPEADQAILEATVVELAEHGFGGLTVDAVAARAGVGKATIYRRWPSKAALALDAASNAIPDLEVPDTGSLRDDLVDLFAEAYTRKGDEHHHHMMAGILAESVVNDEVKEILREFVQRRRTTSHEVVRRAQRRGELSGRVDPELVTDLIGGGLMYRNMMRGLDIDRRGVAQVVDAALEGVVGRRR